jgi:septal ring factor EnvC (AmiA/AmiB activator)
MNGKTKQAYNSSRGGGRHLRSAAGFLVVAFGVVAALLVAQFREEAATPYDPALNALLKAQTHLGQSYHPQENLLRDLQHAHRELSAAVDLLAAAERTDPAMGKKIEELRSKLRGLETEEGMEQMTLEQLHKRYRTLTAELKELIHERLERSQHPEESG